MTSKVSLSLSIHAVEHGAQHECNKSLGASERELDRLHKLREKYKEQQKELEEKEKHKNLCDDLRVMLRNNRFLEFIAAEYLQEICGHFDIPTPILLTKHIKNFLIFDNTIFTEEALDHLSKGMTGYQLKISGVANSPYENIDIEAVMSVSIK